MKKIKYWILAMLLAPFGAQALTVDVWMEPVDNGPYTIGDTFSIDIWASWDVQLVSGGVNLEFDNNIVNAIGSTMNISGSMPPKHGNIGVGAVNDIGFISYTSYFAPGTHNLATVNFVAVGEGETSLALSASMDANLIWEGFDPGAADEYPQALPTFTPGSATVVPLPAAAWFMMSGLGFLAFRRKRSA